jgi:hypothetical protein
MSEQVYRDELYARLQFLAAMTREGLPGAELAIVVRLTLGQTVSARELGLSRQGFKRAVDALVEKRLILHDGRTPSLHPEVCAKFGIQQVNNASKEFIRRLADASRERPPAKNLYRCNADGSPATTEEIEVLYVQLFDVAVSIAADVGGISREQVQDEYKPLELSRELEMKALAALIQAFLERRLPKGLPRGLSWAVHCAALKVVPSYAPVLDPHAVLERFRAFIQRTVDRDRAKLKRAGSAMQAA